MTGTPELRAGAAEQRPGGAARRPGPLTPRPAALRRRSTSLVGSRAEARPRPPRRSGDRDDRRPALPRPSQLPRPLRGAGARRPASSARRRPCWSRSASVQAAADPPARPDDRRGARSPTRPARISATWFNQPWLAEQLEPGPHCCWSARSTGAGSGSSEHEIARAPARRAVRPPGCTPPASSRFIRRARGCARSGSREWVWQASGAWPRDAIEPLPAELRARRGLPGAADALRAVHFPATPRKPRRPASGSPSRSSSSTRRRSRAPAPPRRAPGAAARRRRASWSSAGSPRCPSSRPATSGAPSTRSTRDLDSGEPMQRLLMGEVGSGKTVVALYAMLRALEAGHPGGADGADRDPGRAARGDARPAAGAPRRSPSRCSPVHPGRPAAAMRSAAWPPASSASWSGPTP